MLWETRGFYAPLNAIPDYFLVRWHKDYLSLGSPANILSAWKRQGFTNLLFYKTGADLLRQKTGLLNGEDWNTLDQLLALLPKPQSFGDVYLLYSLTP